MKIVHRYQQDNESIPNWHLDPILTRIFWSRGIRKIDELVYNINNILPPNFKGMNQAANIIAEAVMFSKKIRIIGDYDADGATSTALAMRFFKDIDFPAADYYIPKRQNDGYGLNSDIVDIANEQGIELLITVDNGITAIDAVKRAKELGLSVVITDHHLPASLYPMADAIVNPHQEGCEFKSKNLAGVGVIFYVLTCVRTILRQKGYFSIRNCSEPIMSRYLDLVAVGTVADIVSMDYNNRLMVSLGIQLIRKHMTSAGVEELIKVSGKRSINFTSLDIGFALSPRLNAAGRIDDMKYGVNCLLANDIYEAKTSATLLHGFNMRRKDLEKEMYNIAIDQVRIIYGEHIRTGIVVYHPNFHIGISGILAA
jgi:single-stranded-DNA-specific exonuclease